MQVSGSHYTSGELKQGRLTVMQELGGTVPQVPVEWLLDDLMPSVDFDRATVKARLVDQGHITNGQWSDFPVDPIASAVNEVPTFKPLVSVIQKIVQCAEIVNDAGPSLTFFDNPHRAPKSHRSNDTRPDGYFVRPSDPNRPDLLGSMSQSDLPLHCWDDIALAAEYKKGAADVDKNDNAHNILCSMRHIMHCDPCRRFTYGFTVENTEMRIWFACRSTVFVTTLFNFIEDHGKLIHFVLSYTYAKEQDLGWDPTIGRVYVNGTTQFDIIVHDIQGEKPAPVIYRTTRVIADFGADALRGRGTRIFEAYRWKDETLTGAPVAMKDVWVGCDRDRTGFIRQAHERNATNKDKALVHKYSFKEIGTPIHFVRDLTNFFGVLEDTTIGLSYLHKSGWVHRDISPGNILVVGGGGIIADLDYMRRLDIEYFHEIRTGTIDFDFMPFEAEAQDYLFRVSTIASHSDSLETHTPFPAFQYNPLHDLESLWWIAVWMMLYHPISTSSPDEEGREAAEAQLRAHRDLFPGTLSTIPRSCALTQDLLLRERLARLPKLCHPVAWQLEIIRVALVERYKQAEAGSTIDITAFTGIHQNFIDAFRKARAKSEGLKLCFRTNQ